VAAPVSNLPAAVIQRALQTPEGFDVLYGVNKRKHKMIGLVDFIGGQSKSLQVDTDNGLISSMKLEDYKVKQVVATATQSGTSLILTWSDSGYNQFKVGFAVMDKNRKLGVVLSAAAGTATIGQLTDTLTAGTDFAVGTYAIEVFNISNTYNSTSANFKKYLPDTLSNYLQISRGSMQLSAMEYFKTYIDGTAGSKEHAAALLQQRLALQELADGIEARMFVGQAGTGLPVLPGGELGNTNGGIDWALVNRGGILDTQGSLPDKDYLLDVLTTLREKTGMVSNHFLFIGGPRARMNVAKFMQEYKITAGTSSVLQGKGLAVDGFQTTFGYIEFMDTWWMADPLANPQLSSITNQRKISDEFYIFCIQPTIDAYGADAPLIRMCYKDNQGISTTYVEGLIDANGKRIQGKTASSTDGVTTDFYTNSGIDIVDASGMYGFKLTN
jgi:hypothetical protein